MAQEDVYSRLIKGMDGTAMEPKKTQESVPYSAIQHLALMGNDEVIEMLEYALNQGQPELPTERDEK